MRTQQDIAALEAKLDFGAINQSLLDRLQRGELGQRKGITSLLDRIGDTLVELRRHRVPLREIVAELKRHGLEVGEGRVREYLRNRGRADAAPKTRRKKARSSTVNAPSPRRGATAGSDQASLTLR